MIDHEPPAPDPDAVFTRLHQIRDELIEIMDEQLPGLFADVTGLDHRYCRYNLASAAVSLAFASNRITSPTGSEPTVEPT